MLQRLLMPMALAVAAALVVTLGLQKRKLEERHRETYRRLTQPDAGMFVPPVSTATITGDSVRLGEPSSGRQVLLVFNTSCPYCLASLPAWRRLDSIARASRNLPVRVVGVSLDSVAKTATYAATHALPYATALLTDQKYQQMYRLGSVPHLVVLDSTGRVLYARAGVLASESAFDSVSQALTWRPQRGSQPQTNKTVGASSLPSADR